VTGLGQDVRQALRRMRGAPGVTAAVVLTLAVAIGLDTAAFSLVDALLLRTPPVARPAELAHVYTASDGGLLSHGPLAFPDYEDLRDRAASFSSLAGYAQQPLSIDRGGAAGGDRSALVMGEVVTGGYFETLGLRADSPERGRLLVPGDDAPGAPPVAVLGHGAWQRLFGGDPAAVGRTVRLSGHPFTVVGVAPAGFTGLTRGLAIELWLPVHAAERLPAGVMVGFGEVTPGASRLDDRSRRWIWTVGRLAAGAGIECARSELDTLSRRLAAEHPRTHDDRAFAVEALRDVRVLPGVDGPLLGVGCWG
jgi:putative ABC transport system permease protein